MLGACLVLSLLQATPVQAQEALLSGGDVCSQAYLDSLPQPTPMNGAHRVVQLVNCSSETLLGATNAAHQSGAQGLPVFPREGTWIMAPLPTDPNDHSNILTIDIPRQWERTQCPNGKQTCPAIVGPRFWARTGCRYDIATGRAQCETGGCADLYDCSSGAQVDSGFTTLSEWTFYQTSSSPKIFLDNPDISLVDGSSLNMDIEPVDISGVGGEEGICPAGPLQGQKKCSPFGDHTDQGWLMYNYPLTVHGADLRANDPKTNQNCTDANTGTSFAIKRSDIDKTGYFGFVIEDGQGNPVMPPGDFTLACLSNCGEYEFGLTPSAGCDPTSPDPKKGGTKCYGWNVFCAGSGVHYGGSCKSDKDCIIPPAKPGGKSLDVHAACYYNTPSDVKDHPPTCALRAFYQTPTEECPAGLYNFAMPPPSSPASQVACTFTYGSVNPLDTNSSTNRDYSGQPPAAPCANVIGPDGNPVPCVGDDMIHQVFHGGYTWPNDPEVFGGDSPLYRVIFSPGGTSVPITPATSGIPLCSDLPSNYNYTYNYQQGANTPAEIPVDYEGAVFAVANDMPYDPNNTDWHWSPSLAQGGADDSGVICRWHPAPTGTPNGCSPPLTDQYVTNSACGLIDGGPKSGTSLVSSSFNPNLNDSLFLEITIPQVLNPVRLPTSFSGCATSWLPVSGGSQFINSNQGLVAWYQGTSNNDGHSGAQCQVTVTLADLNPAALKLYDVPRFNGTVEATSSASGNYNGQPSGGLSNPVVYAQASPVSTHNPVDLMLGNLLQVNQQLSPIAYWVPWLTNRNKIPPPATWDCEWNDMKNGNIVGDDHYCPIDDGTDFLPVHGPNASNSDAGHQVVVPGSHVLERPAFITPNFNWGGAAIYIELNPAPLALACASNTAKVGVPYSSQLVVSGGVPRYTYAITSGSLPPGLTLNPDFAWITGTPTTADTYPYTAQVTDAAGNKASNNCSITVSQ